MVAPSGFPVSDTPFFDASGQIAQPWLQLLVSLWAKTGKSSRSPALSGINSDITSLIGLTTALPISEGGTGAKTAPLARTNLGSGILGDLLFQAATAALARTELGSGVTGDLLFQAATALLARGIIQAAVSGSNGDITELTGLLVPLLVSEGGTGLTTGLRTGVFPVATRGEAPEQGVSNGTDTGGTYRVQHQATTNAACGDISFVYGNWYLSAGLEVPGANNITVRASVDLNGTLYPVFFDGSRDVIIQPGATAQSDPLGIDIAAGTLFWSRTFVTVAAAGMTWPLGIWTFIGAGEGNNRNAIPVDLTTSGVVPTVFETAYSPLVVKGTTRLPQSAIALVGDSIMASLNDTLNRGFAERAIAGKYGWTRCALIGDKAINFADPTKRFHRMSLWPFGISHAICDYGINDVTAGSSLAVIQANLTICWMTLAQRGIKVYQTTLGPHTTSSDSWATTVNQTVTIHEAVRVAVNDWIRTTPAPLSGFFELADTVETAHNSGKWINNGVANTYTSDGLHPSAAAAILQSACVIMSVFA